MANYTPETMNVDLVAFYKEECEKYRRGFAIAVLVAVLFLELFGWSLFYIIANR